MNIHLHPLIKTFLTHCSTFGKRKLSSQKSWHFDKNYFNDYQLKWSTSKYIINFNTRSVDFADFKNGKILIYTFTVDEKPILSRFMKGLEKASTSMFENVENVHLVCSSFLKSHFDQSFSFHDSNIMYHSFDDFLKNDCMDIDFAKDYYYDPQSYMWILLKDDTLVLSVYNDDGLWKFLNTVTTDALKHVRKIIHIFTPKSVFLYDYSDFLKQMLIKKPNVFNIVEPSPKMNALFMKSFILNHIKPDLFQVCQTDTPYLLGIGKNQQTFSLPEGTSIDLHSSDEELLKELQHEQSLIDANHLKPAIINITPKVINVDHLKKTCSPIFKKDAFPRFSILALGSVTAQYSGSSAYLVRTSPDTSIMLDFGSYSMRIFEMLYGGLDSQLCRKMLRSIKILFLSHAHEDHINDAHSLIAARVKAFIDENLEVTPLLVVGSHPSITIVSNFIPKDKYDSNISFFPLSLVDWSKGRKTMGDTHDLVSLYTKILEHEPQKLGSDPSFRSPFELSSFLASAGVNRFDLVATHHTNCSFGCVISLFDPTEKHSPKTYTLGYTSDTIGNDKLLYKRMANVDLMLHEASFGDKEAYKFERHQHSTFKQAAEGGKAAKARLNLAVHYSSGKQMFFLPEVDVPIILEQYPNFAVPSNFIDFPFSQIDEVRQFLRQYSSYFMTAQFDEDIVRTSSKYYTPISSTDPESGGAKLSKTPRSRRKQKFVAETKPIPPTSRSPQFLDPNLPDVVIEFLRGKNVDPFYWRKKKDSVEEETKVSS